MRYGITHGPCMDGTASAWVLRKRFPDIEIIWSGPYLHEWTKRKHDFRSEDEIYFVDLSPRKQDLDELLAICPNVTVIDHHASAKEIVSTYSGDLAKKFIFDMDKCGASLAWSVFFPNTPKPLLIAYVECMDLWKWERMPNSRELAEYINFKVLVNHLDTFDDVATTLNEDNLEKYVDYGRVMLERKLKDCEQVCIGAKYLDYTGEKVLSVNQIGIFASETGHMLAEKSDNGIGIAYHILPDNTIKFSVRGTKTSGNAARLFAERFGGGGHDAAAAFTMPLNKFVEVLKKSHVPF